MCSPALMLATSVCREKVADRAVRPIEPALAAVPPQAIQCALAYVKVGPGVRSPWGTPSHKD